MVDDARQSFNSDRAFTDFFMAVLVAAERVFAVVEVDRLQARKTNRTVKLLQYTVKIVNDVITAIADVARIQTDAQLFLPLGAVDDLPQLLKRAADLAALAGHGFQQNGGVLFRRQNAVEQLHNLGDARFHVLLHMAARMKIVIGAGDRFQTPQIILHNLKREVTRMLVRRTGIQRIRRVSHNHRNTVLRSKRNKRRLVRGIRFFGSKTAWISSEELKGVCADRNGLLPHV